MTWTNDSIVITKTSNYLDRLYRVYPMADNPPRPLCKDRKDEFIDIINSGDNKKLVKHCMEIAKGNNIFPIKDSYIAYLKHDSNAIDLNPETINRIAGRIKSLVPSKAIEVMESPKETNRQLGQVVKQWIDKEEIGVPVFTNIQEFKIFKGNKILSGSDSMLEKFAIEYIEENESKTNYDEFILKNKGLDFVAIFNGKLIIAEFKWLTDRGGHQDRQLTDALGLASLRFNNVVPIAVLDGVCWIPNANVNGKKAKKGMHDKIIEASSNGDIIMSVLLLSDYLYSV